LSSMVFQGFSFQFKKTSFVEEECFVLSSEWPDGWLSVNLDPAHWKLFVVRNKEFKKHRYRCGEYVSTYLDHPSAFNNWEVYWLSLILGQFSISTESSCRYPVNFSNGDESDKFIFFDRFYKKDQFKTEVRSEGKFHYSTATINGEVVADVTANRKARVVKELADSLVLGMDIAATFDEIKMVAFDTVEEFCGEASRFVTTVLFGIPAGSASSYGIKPHPQYGHYGYLSFVGTFFDEPFVAALQYLESKNM